LRTLQRRIKRWRATEGPAQEVYCVQEHRAGELCASGFTHMTELGITIGGEPFAHRVYHFVLPYSNWEARTICASESFVSLSEGLENALWELGGVPLLHRTDRMTAAVNNLSEQADFQEELSDVAAALWPRREKEPDGPVERERRRGAAPLTALPCRGVSFVGLFRRKNKAAS